jgi:hypothetical protein
MSESITSQSALPFDDAEPDERWLPAVDYEGFYEVSSLGRVRSLHAYGGPIRKRGERKTYPNGRGYLALNLSKLGVVRQEQVHQLVAAAFIGPCPEGQEVRHGPNGKLDNRASQLCYGTKDQQAEDKVRDGTDSAGVRNGRAKLTEDDVRDIRTAYARGTSQVALAKQYGLTQASVSALVLRKTWRHVA